MKNSDFSKTHSNRKRLQKNGWSVISEAYGGLFAQLEEGAHVWFTRKLPEEGKDPESEIPIDCVFFSAIVEFLKPRADQASESKVFTLDNGHPSLEHYLAAPINNGWYCVSGTSGAVQCYRFPDGVIVTQEMWCPEICVRDNREEDPYLPFFYLEEFDQLIQFLEDYALVEGGLVR